MRPYLSILLGLALTPVILVVCFLLWLASGVLWLFRFHAAEIAMLNAIDQALEAGIILLKP